MSKFLPKRLILLLPGIVAFLATMYAQQHSDWAEAYSQSVYPALSSVVGFLPALGPYSVGEWVVALFLLFCLGYVGYCLHAVVVGGRAVVKHHVTVPESHVAGRTIFDRESDFGDVSSTYEKESVADKNNSTDGENNGADGDGGVPDSSSEKRQIRGSRWLILYRGVVGALAIVSVVYCAFTVLCGLNYYRYTFSSYLGYEVEQSSVAELEQLCSSLASSLGDAREALGEDANLTASDAEDFASCVQVSVTAMQQLAVRYPVLQRPFYSEPKPVIASELMSDAGIAGIFFPFTMESNVNDDIPLFTLSSTMAHELAHQCGFMREDEANFIAYLACMQADDPLARYSGLYLAFMHATNALSSVDAQAAYNIRLSLPQVVQQDMQTNNLFWATHEGIVSDVSESVNDTYLKANNQSDGTSSYGRMVDLLLAEQRASTEASGNDVLQ